MGLGTSRWGVGLVTAAAIGMMMASSVSADDRKATPETIQIETDDAPAVTAELASALTNPEAALASITSFERLDPARHGVALIAFVLVLGLLVKRGRHPIRKLG